MILFGPVHTSGSISLSSPRAARLLLALPSDISKGVDHRVILLGDLWSVDGGVEGGGGGGGVPVQ